MSGAESPQRSDPAHVVTVEDVRSLLGPATPHFALQIRDRVRKLIAGLAPEDPARIEGERGIEWLQEMAREGQGEGIVAPLEQPLPSLRLPRSKS